MVTCTLIGSASEVLQKRIFKTVVIDSRLSATGSRSPANFSIAYLWAFSTSRADTQQCQTEASITCLSGLTPCEELTPPTLSCESPLTSIVLRYDAALSGNWVVTGPRILMGKERQGDQQEVSAVGRLCPNPWWHDSIGRHSSVLCSALHEERRRNVRESI